MPVTPTYPGVYIEEIPSGVRTITGVATSITALVGRALRGPTKDPITINSYGDFERTFGGLWAESSLGFAVRDFFMNGGAQAIIVRLFHPYFATNADQAEALAAAKAVADAASDTASVANATPDLVKTAARAEANKYTTEPKMTAADVVAKTAEAAAAGPPGATPDSVMRAARSKASDPANAADPRKTAADLVAKAAEAAAGQATATVTSVKYATRTAADDATKAADDVAKAAETATVDSGATADSVKTDARSKASDSANAADPRKTAADLVAKAAEAAAGQSGATPTTVKDAARTAADAIKAAADLVAKAAEEEAAKWLSTVVDAAAAAVVIAAPLTKARLAADTLNLEAASEGAWGNLLLARVDHDVSADVAQRYGLQQADLFNLYVHDKKTGFTEQYRNVSVKQSPRKVDKVLQQESKLVRVDDALPTARPNKHADPLAGKSVWDDNSPATSSKVGTANEASDGVALTWGDFIGTGKEGAKEGLYSLEKTDLFNLLCIPPYLSSNDVDASLVTAAATYCEKRRAMLIIDAPSNWNTKEMAKQGIGGVGTTSKNSAVFFPRLKQPNPLRDNQVEEFVPCGAVAGIFARTDTARGVWKAPAGLDATLHGVPELSVPLTDAENGELNPLGINCLRSMPAAGRVIWGSRTLQGDDRLASEWKYISVRRTALFIEESLYRGTQWVVFEPNDEPLWAQIRLNVGSFMHSLFRQGAFQGSTPREAYFVKCDKETTTQNDINLGIVNILVGFAPLKPAEFVIIKIQQIAGQIQT